MNFYKHHLGDYAAATSHLTWDEDMAYTRLMRVYYQHEKPIPADKGQACRLARATTPAQKRAVETVLNEFFELGDEGWRQKRCEEEIAAMQSRAEKNREIGKRGGRPRKTETEPIGNPNGFHDETQTVSENNPSQKPDTRSQKPDKTSGESTASSAPESRAIPNPPRQPGDWLSHFRQKHGLQLDPSSVHDRKKVWPIFTGWCNAGLTLERVDAAVAQAQAQATETIAFLPGYVDRVIASQAAPKQTATATRDQERADVIATLTGRKQSHERTSDTLDVVARRVD